MKIFTASQQKELDLKTILAEPISPFDLMKRASAYFCEVFIKKVPIKSKVTVYCGTGNNGGDGICIAKILYEHGYDVCVILLGKKEGTPEFQIALQELTDTLPNNHICLWPQKYDGSAVAIDAIFGIGLNRKATGIHAEAINHLHSHYDQIISVDIPSGMYADKVNDKDDTVVNSSECFTFNAPKLSFFLPENGDRIPKWTVIDIGIDRRSKKEINSNFFTSECSLMNLSILKRPKFSHKGTFGHGLLWAGSYGMYGAANLAAKASLRTGLGKLTVLSDRSGFVPLQVNTPEAMFLNESDGSIPTTISAIAIGPGLGQKAHFLKRFNALRNQFDEIPWIIDADGLNEIAKVTNWGALLPSKTILTPHPKEFDRLMGKSFNHHLKRIKTAQKLAKKYKIVIVLKGTYTAICDAEGSVTFNVSGNDSLATAGSGDVLTGIILAFISQGIPITEAAKQAVFLHGKLGEAATEMRKSYSVIASDLIENLGKL